MNTSFDKIYGPAKLAVLVSATMLFNIGCASTTTSGSGEPLNTPSRTDISLAKAGLCENPISFERATRYIGIDPKTPRKERLAEKEDAWNDWQSEIASYKKDVETNPRQFAVRQAAAFSKDNDNDGKVDFWKGGETSRTGDKYLVRYQSAIPEKVLYNTATYTGRLPTPAGLIESEKRGDVAYQIKTEKSNRNSVFRDFYGNTGKTPDNIYVINNTRTFYNTATEGKFGGTQMLAGKAMLGVNLEIPQWYNSPESYIQKNRRGRFVFDLNRFDYFDVFGFYPDAKEVYVNIAYIFEFSHCKGTDLYGEVKEVVVSTQKGVEINRIKI